MTAHKDRLKDISQFALPPKGTESYSRFIENFEKNKNNPVFQKFAKDIFQKALTFAMIQNDNGAGLPVDDEIRHFLREYNNRNWEHGLYSMPSSFNVLEGLFRYHPEIQFFELLEEENYIFNIYDFIDFIASSDFNEEPNLIRENLVNDTIYNYNISNSLDDITFTTEDGGEYVIGGISIVRRENEAIVFLLTGEITDTTTATNKLKLDNFKNVPGKENLTYAKDLQLEAVKLYDKENIWKTLAYCRIDLSKLTIDSRYVQKDIGIGYLTITDDISPMVDFKGNYISAGLEEIYKKLKEEIVIYSPLFEFAIKALYLPYYFNRFEDNIKEEEHETKLFNQKKPRAVFKKDKIVSHLRIRSRTVWCLERNAAKKQDTIYFGENDFRIERDGFWKRIDFNSIGKDKNGKPIHGRTWVDTTKTWYESQKQTLTVNVNKQSLPSSNNPKEGSIYIMRNASHSIDIFKIGLTTRDSKIRAKELSTTTGSPDKFLVANEWNAKDCVLAEKLIHEKLDKYRVNESREFFKIDYSVASKVISEIVERINKSNSIENEKI